MDNLAAVEHYHAASKHDFNRFARSRGYLDWENQPNPFRSYDGAAVIKLPQQSDRDDIAYDDLYVPGAIDPAPVTIDSVGDLLRHSLALSAWKQVQASRWALRVNPSSGNLHPTEAYVVGNVSGGDAPGVFHYAPDRHALERRCTMDDQVWRHLTAILPGDGIFVATTSIHWRESWKYGVRAFRYCQHDLGHALAALRFGAAALGWTLQLLPAFSDAAVSALLGLDRLEDFPAADLEEPGFIAFVSPSGLIDPAGLLTSGPRDETLELVRGGEWQGLANRLSPARVDWPLIDGVSAATFFPGWESAAVQHRPTGETKMGEAGAPARRVILQRRSAAAFDPAGETDRETFFGMLSRLVPGPYPPWNALWWPPHVHLLLFVHRVSGLQPGMYCLTRRKDAPDRLRAAMHDHFLWEEPDGVPASLPLHLLEAGDVRQVAAQLSCDQDIAGDSYFSLGMLADFRTGLDTFGPWFYRNLFWESGVIGQVLYLQAEAHGCRGTGIGCYYDDPVHRIAGVRDDAFQSLYHFTVGKPVEDPRLATLPPYPDAT